MTSKQTGAWPVEDPADLTATDAENEAEYGDQYMKAQAEKARRHHVYASIEQHLTEQPSRRSVRSVLRRYHRDLDLIGDRVIAEKTKAETRGGAA